MRCWASSAISQAGQVTQAELVNPVTSSLRDVIKGAWGQAGGCVSSLRLGRVVGLCVELVCVPLSSATVGWFLRTYPASLLCLRSYLRCEQVRWLLVQPMGNASTSVASATECVDNLF